MSLKTEFQSCSAFSALSLHEKNAHPQDLAGGFLSAKGQEDPQPVAVLP